MNLACKLMNARTPWQIAFAAITMFVCSARCYAQDVIQTLDDSKLEAVLKEVGVKKPAHVKEGHFGFGYGTMNDVTVTILNKNSDLIFGAKFKTSRPIPWGRINALNMRWCRFVVDNDGSFFLLSDYLIEGGVTERNLANWLKQQLSLVGDIREVLNKP